LDEKLLFHVRAYECAFKVQLTILAWDKLSSNDHVGDARFVVADLRRRGMRELGCMARRRMGDMG
jgi:hypothetical protein